jgi:hydroxyethylthiazole kinase
MTASDLFGAIEQVRSRAPLVHCLTNLVVTNFTANVLLAVGAAPAMVVAIEEVADFTPLADALSVNLGTLDAPQAEAIRAAVAAAQTAGKPWVLDPVAVGPLPFRTALARELLAARPSVVRGNASEIISLAGGIGGSRGVDSTAPSSDALDAARRLAQATGCVVAVTGAIDYVTDGTRTASLANGTPLMTRVTGVGCALSATVAACVGAGAEPWHAALAALAYSSVAGQLAAHSLAAPLPGSFAVAYLDQLATLDAAAFAATLRYREL